MRRAPRRPSSFLPHRPRAGRVRLRAARGRHGRGRRIERDIVRPLAGGPRDASRPPRERDEAATSPDGRDLHAARWRHGAGRDRRRSLGRVRAPGGVDPRRAARGRSPHDGHRVRPRRATAVHRQRCRGGGWAARRRDSEPRSRLHEPGKERRDGAGLDRKEGARHGREPGDRARRGADVRGRRMRRRPVRARRRRARDRAQGPGVAPRRTRSSPSSRMPRPISAASTRS